MHTYKYLLTTLFIFYASLAHAAPDSSLKLNSQDAVALALQKNQSLMAARSAIEKAGAYSQYAGRLDNPELKLGYASDRTFNGEGERSYSIGFEQRFPITKRLKLLKNVSAIEVKLAEAELRDQERLLIRDIESAVELISSLNQRLSLLDGMIRLQEGFAVFLEKRIESGEASTLDLNQVRVSVFAAKQEIQNLTKQRDGALGTLRSLLALEPGAELEILANQTRALSLPQMPALEGEVLQSHPEYQLKASLVEIARGQTSLAKANRWADVAVEVFFEEERAVDEPSGVERDRFFGIGVSIPLPLHDNNRGEIEASRFREQQIRYELNAVSLRLKNEAETLRRNAEATYRQITKYKESAVGLVEQNLEDINNAYAQGQVDLGEVFRVQEQHLNIQTAQLELLHELEQILIEWRAATGNNLPNPSTGELSYETE
ncbi:TolC family protein [Opitutales bacterium]|nr:TolC family protein [Opitutales bacterium]